MDKELNKSEVEDRICQLTNIAEMFLGWSSELSNLYKENLEQDRESFFNNPITNLLILHQVLYFQEAISILNSLLESKGSPNEVSFKYYLKNFKNKINDSKRQKLEGWLKKRSKIYNASYFEDYRNSLIDHKNINSVGDPSVLYLNPLKSEYLDKANCIIEKIKNALNEYFDVPFNNSVDDYYKESFQDYYKYFKDNLNHSK